MPKVSELVEQVLRDVEHTRDSDTLLILHILSEMGADLSERQIMVFRNLNMESVTRARRKFNQEGKYLPTDPVARERRMKSLRIQQVIPMTAAEKTADLIGERYGRDT